MVKVSPKSFNLITQDSEAVIFCTVKLAQAACEVTQMEERSAMCKLSYICELVVFRSDEKIGYGIVWELQNDDRSLDAHDRLLLTPIKILIHPKYC